MRSLLSSMIVAAALAGLTGCGGNVVVGSGGGGNGSGGNGNGGAGGDNVDPTGGPQPTSPGYAIAVGSSDVFVRFLSQPLACENQDFNPSGCSWWSVEIGLPADLFVPGSVDLETAADTKILVQEWGDPNSPNENDCPGVGGGGMLPATLVIHSVSATQAELELQGVNGFFLSAKPDGFYTAPRCN